MSYYFRDGNRFNVTNEGNIDIHETLPVGNYVVKFDDFRKAFFLELIEDFSSVGKLYGNCEARASRIINTFLGRDVSTGVVLNGEKGSGKTLLARTISQKCAQSGIPTIIINQGFCGDEFNGFIQNISQLAVVIFDEFEKVYDKEAQEKILTLLDGVYPTKKLYVLTCNDKYRIDSHMRNRPGRIYYMIDFVGLETEFVREYCEDNLKNKNHVEGVVTIATAFNSFNFDMLKALVEEMNRYNETAADAIQMLNAKPNTEDGGVYDVVIKSKTGETISTHDERRHGNPLMPNVLSFWTCLPGNEEDFEITFSRSNLVKIDQNDESFVFVNEDGYVLKMTRQKFKEFNFAAF